MKIIKRAVIGLLLAGGVAAVGWKQNAIAEARAEHQALMSESEEARRLTEENKGIGKLRGEHEELEKLRGETRDLPKLRNEARQLRRQAEELAKLRAENERLRGMQASGAPDKTPAPLPPNFVARAAMVDAGLGSPEATAQTFFWAMSQGNTERLSECSVNGPRSSAPNPDKERADLVEQMKDFPGFGITERRDISPDEVELSLQTAAGGSAVPMKLKRVDGGWKVE